MSYQILYLCNSYTGLITMSLSIMKSLIFLHIFSLPFHNINNNYFNNYHGQITQKKEVTGKLH